MIGYTRTEEIVISEFTLALLEDSGYYKANYYTGGLMRYGKNKGCKFLKETCVDRTIYEIDPKFENEFYDSIYSSRLIDPSCSSGRQSRTYNAWFVYSYLPNNYPQYVYFRNNTYGGFGPANFCPVGRIFSRKKKLHIILVIAIIKVMEIMVHEYIIAITKLILVKHYYRFQGKSIQTILFVF